MHFLRTATYFLKVVFFFFIAIEVSGCGESTANDASTITEHGLKFCEVPSQNDPSAEEKFALVIGVGDYPQSEKWKLAGPVNDMAMMRKLLLSQGYKESHICELPDKHATFENVTRNFKSFIADNADQNDQVTIYFSGHGTEIPSTDSDETYGLDQALVLYDSGQKNSDGSHVPYLIDDDFAGLLSLVRDKTNNMTVVIDACHSGTVTRGDYGHSKSVKLNVAENHNFQDSQEILRKYGARRVLDNSSSWSSIAPDGTVVLAAARDGTLAYEVDGHGTFTKKIYEAFINQQGSMSLQSARQIISSNFVGDRQSPVFHGNPYQRLFSKSSSNSKLNMIVSKSNENTIDLEGLLLPSYGNGAVFRMYKSNALPADLKDTEKLIAMGKVSGSSSPTSLKLESVGDGSFDSVNPGDIAVLHSPSLNYRKFRVDVRTLNSTEKSQLSNSIQEKDLNGDLKSDGIWRLVELANEPTRFSVRKTSDNNYEILGPEGATRNREKELSKIAKHLKNHTKQWSLRQLIGEGGKKFQDNLTLETKPVGIKENQYPDRTRCLGEIAKRKTSEFQDNPEKFKGSIPLCAIYQIEVRADFTKLPGQDDIQIGAFMMLYDGRIEILSFEDVKLSKERPVWRSAKVNETKGIFQAYYKPYAITNSSLEEEIIVLGVDQDDDFPWYLFSTDNESERSKAASTSGLGSAIELYLDGNTRDTLPSSGSNSEWTVSRKKISYTIDSFEQATNSHGAKEYTLNDVDINFYMPANDPALTKVLLAADKLTKASSDPARSDGFPYAQHNWCEGSDKANLSKGIDCSRAIWYAFTRSGLPYTSAENKDAPRNQCQAFNSGTHGYLPTKQMASPDGLSSQFDDCLLGRDFKTGDVLVYRDEGRNVGHTVMVIDPYKKIAWGSHGWDGNPLIGQTADTGVEYQTILKKADWGAWDRSTMRLKACWRHKNFASSPQTSMTWLSNYYCDNYTNGCPLNSDSP